MAYESVKNQIDAYIKANGVNLITGPVLNAVLTTMLDELGEGYAFQGVLDTTDTPSPAADIPQAWLASEGTYLGGSITVDEDELALIIHTSNGWSKETVYRGVQLSHDAIVSALGYTPADDADLAEKQDTIADLSAIRSGSALGSTSVQPVDIEDMVEAEPIGSIIPPVNPSKFATKEEVKELDDIVNGETEHAEEEAQYSNPGFIAVSNGTIQNTSSTWIHSDIIPIAEFVSAGKIFPHGSVAGVAFYNGSEYSNYISGINYPTIDSYLVDREITKDAIASVIPEGATHIAFSTDSSQYTLKVKTQKTITSDGLTKKVENLEESSSDLASRVITVEEEIYGTSSPTPVQTQYSESGYIKNADGAIQTGNSWIHSPLIPVDDFISAEGFVYNGSVANVAFYSANNRDSYISGYQVAAGYQHVKVSKTDLSIPTNAKYVSLSTNGDTDTLVVTTAVAVKGLEERVEDLENATVTPQNLKISPRMIHFSFDDTISALYDIAHNSRASIFDNAFFAALKTLHETYGCVFSCYCFLHYFKLKRVNSLSNISSPDTTAVCFLSTTDGTYTGNKWYVYRNSQWVEFTESLRSNYVVFSLSSMPSTWATEFSENADWLRFGLHGKDGMTNYSGGSGDDAAQDYSSFITAIINMTGTPKCLDTVVRLQNFSGSLEVCRAMRDADGGVQGFLCDDYSETGGGAGGTSGGYYLASPIPTAIWKKGQYYDPTERLHFYMSALRLDNIQSSNIQSYMAGFLTARRWEQTAMLEMYCHENQMYKDSDNSLTADYVERFSGVCSWAADNGFTFGYEMDRIRMSF